MSHAAARRRRSRPSDWPLLWLARARSSRCSSCLVGWNGLGARRDARRRLHIIGARESSGSRRGRSWSRWRGRTRAGLATSAMWRASAFRRTRSPAITGSAATTCSWSAGRTSTARRSWSPRTPRASRRVRPPTASTRSSARISAISGSRTTSSRGRRPRTTTASRATSSGRCTRRASSSSTKTLGAFSASTGHTLPDRYIEGTCPICGFESARGDQCDNCGNQLDPTDLIDPRSKIDGTPPVFRDDEAPLPRPSGVQGAAHRVDRRQDRLAAERPALLAQLREGAEAAADHARPRLGRADPGRGLRGAATTSGSTSGSTRSSATSPPRSSGPRTAARRTRGATGGRTRRRSTPTSWGRTTSSSTR